ncbi:MAG: response regulator transcription factor [Campylobacterales bacterium]
MADYLNRFKHLSLLFVEDDSIILEESVKTLEIFFDKVYSASNGKEALEIYRVQKPNIILSDIFMPNIGGLELVQTIREDDYKTPIIFLSAYSNRDILLKSINLSLDAYLIKPFTLEELLEACYKSVERIEKEFCEQIDFKNGMIYDIKKKELKNGKTIIDMGSKEKALLELLFAKRDKTLSKEEIVYELWPLDSISNSALKSLLSRLRKKIGEDRLTNIRAGGWRLCLE